VLGFLYVAVVATIGGVFAALGTDPATASGALVPAGVWKAAGTLFLCFLSIGGLALFLSLAIRSTGGTMAVWFLWILPVEQLILPGVLGRIIPALRDYFQYQPFTLATRLGEYAWYDPLAWDRLVAAREAAERPVPTPPDVSTAVLVTAGWAVVFLTLAYVTFRRRDL
jgi:ABC-type transport system involved in multi-copper enzyme maturation permease subunit